MPTLTIRQVDDEVYSKLKKQAESEGRSMEAEARCILAEAVHGRSWWARWVEATKDFRGADIPIPDRSHPRDVTL